MKNYTIETLEEDLLKKTVSSLDITKYYIQKARESNLNAFITICEEQAILAAKKADEEIASGNIKPLTGIPIGIKDAFCTKGIKTTMASKMLANFIPQYSATVVERLEDAGAINIGKLNMDEFAMGSRNKNSYFGQAYNPWKIKGEEERLIPGGSSGGSAAAVAGDLCIAATGTDTGGSVRQPAAFCGIVGFKPSYGAVSRSGIIAYASSLDQAGFMTKTVKDASLMFELTAGKDGKDSTVASDGFKGVTASITGDVKGLRVGIPKEFLEDGQNEEIIASLKESIKQMEAMGAVIKYISLPSIKHAIKLYYFISTVEASSNLARYDGVRYGFSKKFEDAIGMSYEDFISGNRAEGFGEEVKTRILTGTAILTSGSYAETYEKAMKVRGLICHEFELAFKDVDVILNHTTPNLALRVSESQTQLEEYLNDILTVPINIAGLCSIAIPTVLSVCGRPIGMQLTAKPLICARLLNAAFALESAFGFFGKNYV